MMRLLIRKTIVGLSYGFYLISAVLGIIYFVFWMPFVHELENRHTPKANWLEPVEHVDAQVLKRLGRLSTKKASSFVHFRREKGPGIRRVCAFGDSFTYGNEVAEADDFPSILQDLFERRGHLDIQVLNFGSGWYGFHQSYMMWESVGSHFDCDYVLLGPSGFHPQRDTSFNHTDLLDPYYLHSRFVLEDGGLRLVDVDGNTHAERFSRYFTFFPQWKYLRYDRNPPAILQSMLPEGRTISNPFYYYRGSASEEALETYRRLLRRLAKRASSVVLAHVRTENVELGRSLGIDNLVAVKQVRVMRFPYLAPLDHNSAMGNRILAEQFFAHLVASARGRFDVLVSRDPEPGLEVDGVASARPLSSFERIEIRIDDRPIGRFTLKRRWWKNLHPKEDQIDTLVAIKNPDTPLVDAFFFPISAPPPHNARLVLRVVRGGEIETHVLGRIRWLDPRVRIGSVEVPGIRYKESDREFGIYFKGNDVVLLDALPADGARFELSIGDERLLQGRRRDNDIIFEKGNALIYHLRASEGQGVDVDTLNSFGHFDLVLSHEQDGDLHVPVGVWEKRSIAVPVPERIVTTPIAGP